MHMWHVARVLDSELANTLLIKEVQVYTRVSRSE